MGTIAVGIDRSWTVDLGTICDGESFAIKICNSDGGTHTATIQVCGCPQLTGLTTSIELDACECVDLTGTFTGLGYPNIGDCLIIITFNGKTSYITVRWEEVYCDPALNEWSLTDASSINTISQSNFDPNCAIWTQGTMGEAKTFSMTHTVTQAVIAGDMLYLSQWLFAQLPTWDYNQYPVAGWRYRVCALEETVDGTFDMEWYGQAPSEENSQDSPYVQCVISNSGTTIQFIVNFNLTEDSVSEPNNSGTSTHRMLLANTIQNDLELNNDAENSIYKNPKYLTWAGVLWRSVGNVYQDMIFSIKGFLPFYGENGVANPCVFIYNGITMTTPTGQPTDYLSTVRATKVRVDFTYQSSNLSGTVPDAMWVYLIRNDSNNNQQDFYDNYGYEQADLTTLAVSSNITPITAPTNITGDEFYAEFDVNTLATNLTGVEFISNNYRFIFVVIDQIDTQSRSDITEPIQLINYDDENLALPGLDMVFRTVEQQYAPTVTVLNDLPVNMELETAVTLQLPLSDAEVQAKTGGLVLTAREALQSVALRIYDQNPLTGQVLLNTLFFNPGVQEICGSTTQMNQDIPFVDRSSANTIDLTFPFTVEDNIYRKIGREGLYQSDITEPTAWETLGLASLNCVENRNSENCNAIVLFRLPDVALGNPNPNALIFIQELNQVWTCDSTNDEIQRYDLVSDLVLSPITLSPGDAPVGLIYLDTYSKVYVSCSGTNTVNAIDIYTLAITPITGITGNGCQRFAWVNTNLVNEVYMTNTISANIERISPITDTVVGTPIAISQTLPTDIVYYQPTNTLYVGCLSGLAVRVDVATNAEIATILATANVFRIEIVEDKIWLRESNLITVFDPVTFASSSFVAPGNGDLEYIQGTGVYVLDQPGDVLMLYDANLFLQIDTWACGDAPRDILFVSDFRKLFINLVNDQSLSVFLLESCEASLPSFSMLNKNILFNWDFTFKFFDNEETYTYQQKIIRPKAPNPADFVNDFVNIDVEEYTGGTLVTINNICPTTGKVRVTANLQSPRLAFSVGVELEPIRGGMYSGESSSSPISIPADSPYISNLTPAFGSTSTVQFDLDVPALPIQGDYNILLHFLLK